MDPLSLSRFDSTVMTVGSIGRAVDFYTQVLGFSHIRATEKQPGISRSSLVFGNPSQRINLRQVGLQYEKGYGFVQQPGESYVCIMSKKSIHNVVAHLEWMREIYPNGHYLNFEIVKSGVTRTGGTGLPMNSVIIKDPDGNYVEICSYPHPNTYDD